MVRIASLWQHVIILLYVILEEVVLLLFVFLRHLLSQRCWPFFCQLISLAKVLYPEITSFGVYWDKVFFIELFYRLYLSISVEITYLESHKYFIQSYSCFLTSAISTESSFNEAFSSFDSFLHNHIQSSSISNFQAVALSSFSLEYSHTCVLETEVYVALYLIVISSSPKTDQTQVHNTERWFQPSTNSRNY